MQVAGGTISPWVSMSSWLNAKPLPSAYNELIRLQLDRERERYREHLHQTGGLTFYAYGPYGRKPQPIFRIGGYPGANGERVGAGPDGAEAGWERYPLHQYNPLFGHSANDISRIPEVNLYGTRPKTADVEWEEPRERPRPPEQRPVARAVPSRGRYGDTPYGAPLTPRGALRAWLFASALVILVVLVVRTIDKCLDLNLLKHRRRSQEWATPNVRATSRQVTDSSIVMIPEEEPSSTELRPGQHIDVFSVDLPPPYSECLRDERIPDPGMPKTGNEEPPPDYNEIYVEFSNKNGAPVVICRRRTPLVMRREIADTHSSANIDNEVTSEPFNNVQDNNDADNATVADQNEASNNMQDVCYVINYLPSTSGETIYIDMENNQNTDINSEDTNGERVIMA